MLIPTARDAGKTARTSARCARKRSQRARVDITVEIGACVAALPTMLLWNWLVPSIFHLREIGFLEALGMLILSGLLVRGGGASKSS